MGWHNWIMFCQDVHSGKKHPSPEELKDLARFARLGLMLVVEHRDHMETLSP